jgi:DNA-binding transcriptional ArsR family regulator
VVLDMGADLHYPTPDELRLVDVLQALSDPVRLEIVRILAGTDHEVACGQMALPVGKATSSHHFRVLREAGVLRGRIEGTRRFYRLRTDELNGRFPGLLDSVLRAAATEPHEIRKTLATAQTAESPAPS